MAIQRCDERYGCPGCIECMLYQYSSNFGRGSDYRNSVRASWLREFKTTPDRILKESVHQVIRETKDSFIPPLGAVIDIVKAKMGGTHTDRSYQKCDHCDRQGFRYVAVHYEHAPKRMFLNVTSEGGDMFVPAGKPYVHQFTVKCNCQFGERMAGAGLNEFMDKAERTMRDCDHVRCYHVSMHGQQLSREQTTTFEEQQQWKRKVRDPDNPYRKMLSALLQERRT